MRYLLPGRRVLIRYETYTNTSFVPRTSLRFTAARRILCPVHLVIAIIAVKDSSLAVSMSVLSCYFALVEVRV